MCKARGSNVLWVFAVGWLIPFTAGSAHAQLKPTVDAVPKGHSAIAHLTRLSPVPADICLDDFLAEGSEMVRMVRQFKAGAPLVVEVSLPGTFAVDFSLWSTPETLGAAQASAARRIVVENTASVAVLGSTAAVRLTIRRKAPSADDEKRLAVCRAHSTVSVAEPAWLPRRFAMSSKRQTVPENVSIDLELMPSAPGSTFDCRPATHRWPSLCDEWQAHANFSQHAGEAIAIDDRVLAPGVYDLFVAVNVRTSSGSFVTTPLTGMRERIRIGPTWTTTSVQLWPGSRWSKPVSVRLRGRPSQMPDGDMCVHPIGPSGWECSTSELFRCELVIDRGPDRGVHAQEECFESLAYQQLHNRLCSRGVRMRWSEFDRKTRCHPVQPR